MTEIPTTLIPKSKTRHNHNAASPFRYPGGKAFLSEYLISRLPSRDEANDHISMVEPFCGGAGASLNLLADDHVGFLHLNDADLRIYSAWYAMLNDSDRFINALLSTPLTMEEWYAQRKIATANSYNSYSFELAFASFYMNRTTRSGIIERAGPIGGYDQTGNWKINARFNREKLASQVEWIASMADKIHLTNLDALTFIEKTRNYLIMKNTLYFIDPPYVQAGSRLYYNGMTEAKHIALSDILNSGKIPNWILTYDDDTLIRELYQNQNVSKISVNYSLQSKRKENELLITPL